jgi:lysophospholipase L1-like esterase
VVNRDSGLCLDVTYASTDADFDAATRDATNPPALNPQYDSRDHLHPDDAGYQAMANAVDLTMLTC